MNANKKIARKASQQPQQSAPPPMLPQPIMAMLKMLISVNDGGARTGALAVVENVRDNAVALLELGLKAPRAVELVRDWCGSTLDSFNAMIEKLGEAMEANPATPPAPPPLHPVPPAPPAGQPEESTDGTDGGDGDGDQAAVGGAERQELDEPKGVGVVTG